MRTVRIYLFFLSNHFFRYRFSCRSLYTAIERLEPRLEGDLLRSGDYSHHSCLLNLVYFEGARKDYYRRTC